MRKIYYSISRLKTFLFLLMVGTSIVACKKDADEQNDSSIDPEEFNRKEMLENAADNYVLPAYNNYLSRISDLKISTNIFESQPTIQNLNNLRVAWKQALFSWEEVSFLNFGPASHVALNQQVNIFPVDTTQLLTALNVGNTNFDLPDNYKIKGFQALDYLLYGLSKEDSVIVNRLGALSYLAYLKELVVDIQEKSMQVVNEWNSGYRDSFVSNSASNAQGSSVSIVLNGLSSYYESVIRKGKVGVPSGVFNGFSKQAMPGHVEGLYSGISLELLQKQMTAFSDFFNGIHYVNKYNGTGIDDYAEYAEATHFGNPLEVEINKQFKSINDKSKLIAIPLSQAVTQNSVQVTELYDELQKLVPMIKIDLVNAFGVLITYQDSDGD